MTSNQQLNLSTGVTRQSHLLSFMRNSSTMNLLCQVSHRLHCNPFLSRQTWPISHQTATTAMRVGATRTSRRRKTSTIATTTITIALLSHILANAKHVEFKVTTCVVVPTFAWCLKQPVDHNKIRIVVRINKTGQRVLTMHWWITRRHHRGLWTVAHLTTSLLISPISPCTHHTRAMRQFTLVMVKV